MGRKFSLFPTSPPPPPPPQPPMSDSDALYIGIDVGTGSARAALTRSDGTLLHSGSYEIRTWRSATDHRIYEQSTSDIWGRICAAVKDCLEGAAQEFANQSLAWTRSGVPSELAKRVRGIGFDATCSLAVTDFDGESISVTDGADLGSPAGERNVILWADHRAEKEAEEINSTVGDGDPQDPLVKAEDETRSILQMPILRPPRLPHVPSHGQDRQVMLLISV
ncbi:hypothetical protein NMY22_g15865 [Coprinellus aureogranulatus]|nr:hypothetical protein NMY22_g15865 [Coprinellus aureogranulatus]